MNAKVNEILVFVLLSFQWGIAVAGDNPLDVDRAELCMQVAVRARIIGFEDFELTTEDSNGSGGARYAGSDRFLLEANAPVRLLISGGTLKNGQSLLETNYSIDGKEGDFFTGTGVHNEVHVLAAMSQLGDISEQLAGRYSANVTLTVAPQVSALPVCQHSNPQQRNDNNDLVESSAAVIIQEDLEEQADSHTEEQLLLLESLDSLGVSEFERMPDFIQEELIDMTQDF